MICLLVIGVKNYSYTKFSAIFLS